MVQYERLHIRHRGNAAHVLGLSMRGRSATETVGWSVSEDRGRVRLKASGCRTCDLDSRAVFFKVDFQAESTMRLPDGWSGFRVTADARSTLHRPIHLD